MKIVSKNCVLSFISNPPIITTKTVNFVPAQQSNKSVNVLIPTLKKGTMYTVKIDGGGGILFALDSDNSDSTVQVSAYGNGKSFTFVSEWNGLLKLYFSTGSSFDGEVTVTEYKVTPSSVDCFHCASNAAFNSFYYYPSVATGKQLKVTLTSINAESNPNTPICSFYGIKDGVSTSLGYLSIDTPLLANIEQDFDGFKVKISGSKGSPYCSFKIDRL